MILSEVWFFFHSTRGNSPILMNVSNLYSNNVQVFQSMEYFNSYATYATHRGSHLTSVYKYLRTLANIFVCTVHTQWVSGNSFIHLHTKRCCTKWFQFLNLICMVDFCLALVDRASGSFMIDFSINSLKMITF